MRLEHKTKLERTMTIAFTSLPQKEERVSLDDISRQAQPNPLHPQHGSFHHG
jgi:translation initiation factor 2 beta subunit (eIF-2beta)/eIF-5